MSSPALVLHSPTGRAATLIALPTARPSHFLCGAQYAQSPRNDNIYTIRGRTSDEYESALTDDREPEETPEYPSEYETEGDKTPERPLKKGDNHAQGRPAQTHLTFAVQKSGRSINPE